jgi:hypothetical protein
VSKSGDGPVGVGHFERSSGVKVSNGRANGVGHLERSSGVKVSNVFFSKGVTVADSSGGVTLYLLLAYS